MKSEDFDSFTRSPSADQDSADIERTFFFHLELLDQLPHPIRILDARWRVVYANPAARASGWADASCHETRHGGACDPADLEQCPIAAVQKSGRMERRVHHHTDPSGRAVIHEVMAVPIFFGPAKEPVILEQVRDVTDLLAAQIHFQRVQAILGLLARIAGSQTPDEVVAELPGSLLEATGADWVAVFRAPPYFSPAPSEDGGRGAPQHGRGSSCFSLWAPGTRRARRPQEPLPTDATFGKCCLTTLTTGRLLVVPDPDLPAEEVSFSGAQILGGLLIPLRSAVRLEGVAVVADAHWNRRWDPATVNGLEVLAAAFHERWQREEMTQRLAAAERQSLLSQFAAGIGHDLNNLLMVVSTGIEAAWLKRTFEAQHLAALRQAIQQGGQLARSLVTLSRNTPSTSEPVDLTRTVSTLAPLLRHLVPTEVELVIQVGDAITVLADPKEVEQALLNLVKNAGEAVPGKGRVEISTFAANVREDFLAGRPWARCGSFGVLRVSDTGMGIPPEDMRAIFQPFFTRKGNKGTGLGLAVVLNVARRHGGFVEVSSALGQGATFEVFLPLLAPDVATEPESPPAPGWIRALLVEDNHHLAQLTAHLLRGEAIEVTVAHSCREAQALLETTEKPVDVVILDRHLPDGDGRELVKPCASGSQVGVVLWTAEPPTDPVPAPWQLVLKPCPIAELAEAIRKAVGKG